MSDERIPSAEELEEAAHLLQRLRGLSFQIVESWGRSRLVIEGGQQPPSATHISKCLYWGATALLRQAKAVI